MKPGEVSDLAQQEDSAMRVPERLESLVKLINEGRVLITINGDHIWSNSDDGDGSATETVRMIDIILKSGRTVEIGFC